MAEARRNSLGENCANCAAEEGCARSGCFWEATLRACRSQKHSQHELRRPGFVPVEVRLVDERLHFVHDGHHYAQGLHVPGWTEVAAAHPWALVLGARTSLLVDDHWVRNVFLQQGALVGHGSSAVRLITTSKAACNTAAELSFT